MHDQALVDLLQSDLTSTNKLAKLLQVEREQLESRDSEALNKTLAEKSEILANIEQNDQQRKTLLAQSNYTEDSGDLLEFYSSLPEPNSAKCVEYFTSLQQLIEKCKVLNDVNGAIVRRSKASSSHVLNILRGRIGNPDLYTNAGDTSTHNETRPIAKA